MLRRLPWRGIKAVQAPAARRIDHKPSPVKAAKALAEAGQHEAAALVLRQALAQRGADVELHRRLARALRRVGDIAAETEAWEGLLAVDPGRAEAHAELAKIHLRQGRPHDAAPHLEALARQAPDDLLAWKRLAICRRQADDQTGEAVAWRRVLAEAPDDPAAHDRMAELASALGLHAEAAVSFKALAARTPGQARGWIALADACFKAGDAEGEAEAWRRALQAEDGQALRRLRVASRMARRLGLLGDSAASAEAWRLVLAQDPHRAEGHARLAEIALYDAIEPVQKAPALPPRRRPRLVVIGNCQAYGLARCLRWLCPEAEVRAIGLAEIDDRTSADAIAAHHADADHVITQYVDAPAYGNLRSKLLRGSGKPMIYFPRINFRGFHPDLLRAGTAPLKGFPTKGFHSALILAAHARGVPQGEVSSLFNAYIYAVLGYFDEYAKAQRFHIQDARRFGVKLAPMIRDWRRNGVFVHVPNHPTLPVFWSIAQSVAGPLGLQGRDVDPALADDFETFGVWPVYPEIARRLDVEGSLEFRLGGSRAPIGLDELIDRSYRAYAALDHGLVLESVGEIVRILKREGV